MSHRLGNAMAILCSTTGGIGTFRLIPATDSKGIWLPLVANPPRKARKTNNLRTDFDDLKAGLPIWSLGDRRQQDLAEASSRRAGKACSACPASPRLTAHRNSPKRKPLDRHSYSPVQYVASRINPFL
jgi:hypothetical protein